MAILKKNSSVRRTNSYGYRRAINTADGGIDFTMTMMITYDSLNDLNVSLPAYTLTF